MWCTTTLTDVTRGTVVDGSAVPWHRLCATGIAASAEYFVPDPRWLLSRLVLFPCQFGPRGRVCSCLENIYICCKFLMHHYIEGLSERTHCHGSEAGNLESHEEVPTPPTCERHDTRPRRATRVSSLLVSRSSIDIRAATQAMLNRVDLHIFLSGSLVLLRDDNNNMG